MKLLSNSHLISKAAKHQLFASCLVTIGGICVGNVFAWPSPAIPNMVERGRNLDPKYTSWIISISLLGAALFILPIALIMERFGRKMAMTVSTITLVVGWIIIVTSNSLSALMIGRFVTGLGSGGYSLSIPMYISEIAQEDTRMNLNLLFRVQIILGISSVYVFGSLLSWIWLSCLCAILPLLHFVSVKFLPESPIFNLFRGRRDEAKESLEWFRGVSKFNRDFKTDFEIQKELEEMEKLIENNLWKLLTCGCLIKPRIAQTLFLSLVLIGLQQFSGIGISVIYSMNLFQTVGNNWNPKMSLIILGAMQVLAVILSTLVVTCSRGGRKILITSSTIMAFSYIALGSVFYEKEDNNGVNTLDVMKWVPNVSLIAYAAFYSIGMGPISLTHLDDILPKEAKVLTLAICTFMNWLLAFIVVKTYEDLSQALGNYGCFWFYAALCFVCSIYVFLILQETKEKSTADFSQKYDCPDSNQVEVSRL